MMRAKSIFIFLTIIYTCQMAMSQSAINLRCFDKVNPTGVDVHPYFGWHMSDPDDDEVQSAYQILVATSAENLTEVAADVWVSDQITSGMQNYVYYTGPALSSGTRYYWTVRIWDKGGSVGEFAPAAYFDTGLQNVEDWAGAKWIKGVNNYDYQYTYFRKKIVTDKVVDRAIVYTSAVHDFEFYIDGELVGKGPGYHYPQYQYYKAYDITEHLTSGNDHLFAMLTHYYKGGQGRPESIPGMIFKTIIQYQDATSDTVYSDNTWKQIRPNMYNPSRPRRNGEGVGYLEWIDYRFDKIGWNVMDYDDSDWAAAVEIGEHPVSAWTGLMQPNLAEVIEEEISPVSVTRVGEKRFIVDMGKVYAGYPQVKISGGEEGNNLSVFGGFTLKDNGINAATNQNTDMVYNFVITGGSVTFQPFIYMGMRYFQVHGSPVVITSEDVKFVTRHFELDGSKSHFQSSHPTLNRVYEVMKHSLFLGAQESFVDTPTREKGGFLGDSWSIGVAAMANMGERVMNLRILNEFLDSQDQYWPDGRMNAVYPNVDGGRDIPDYTQMFLVWAWDYYMQTGNVEFLRQNFSRMKKVADYVDNHTDQSTGLISKLTGGGGAYEFGIIDWPPTMRYGYDAETDMRTVINAYAYKDFETIAKIAEVLDSTAVAATYRQKADDIKAAMNAHLINANGRYIDGLKTGEVPSEHVSQQANMFPLAMGLTPAEHLDSVIAEVKNQKMSCGMVTLRWLPEALGESDQGAHLLELYTNKTWDGWANNISRGATATWESWDALEEGNSLSHPWGAVGLIGLQEYFLGVKVLKPQHEEIQIKPLDFEYAMTVDGSVPTDRGTIAVQWSRKDSTFDMNVNIPDNVVAHVYVPKTGVASNTVIVDQTSVEGEEQGNYLYLGVFGSGEHTFERQTSFAPAPPEPGPDEEQQTLDPWVAPDPEPDPILSGQLAENFKVFPNPGSDKTQIDLGKTYDLVNIEIQDLSGKTMYKMSAQNTQYYDLDMSNLESGVYLVQVSTSAYQESMRLIKH